ncbi:hypothetical protein RHS01_09351 [Rhizoctonia solani]|uniref:Uncharacterized protein n=1 Tax=Rhizoctonia solani TaxID=456999 RepID=A0A8H7M3H7_9AGAM|nr:hypothetical protein RHS01_09351 [Rhizoctonia solani]
MLLVQLCRKAPRTARCTAETDNTLLDVDELVSASFKQVVQFANEDVVEYMAEINASGIEDSYEGNGDGAGSGSEGRDKDANGDDEMAGNPTGTDHHWRGQELSPVWGEGWRKVGIHYNCRVPKKHQHNWECIKDKYNCMAKRRKPTNNGEGSKIHDAVLQLEAERLAQEETVDLDDGSRAREPDMIIIDLTDENAAPLPIIVPAKRKASLSATAKESVMAELGITYYAAKAVQLSEVESTAGCCWDVQTTLDHICATLEQDASHTSAEAAGVAKVEIFGRNCTIEQLKKGWINAKE